MATRKISIQTFFPGIPGRSQPIELTVDENSTLKQVFEEYYITIFPNTRRHPNIISLDSWNECSTEFLRYSTRYFFFGISAGGDTVHLIDRVKDLSNTNLRIGRGGGTNDAIWFYVQQNYESSLNEILSSGTDINEKILRLFESMLSDVDTYVTVDGFTKSQIEKQFRRVVVQWVPTIIWNDLQHKEFNYYNKFITHFATQLFLLDGCLKHIRNGDDEIGINREWTNNFLYKIQFLMLVLLNIPEIYLRSKGHYQLDKAGIDDPYGNESFFNEAHGKSIYQLCEDILEEGNISNNSEFLGLCLDGETSNKTIQKISHTFRRVFNKLKHSSSVSVINSRDHEEIRRQKLADIEYRVELLGGKNYTKPGEVLSEMDKLDLEMQLLSVRDVFEHLDFEDKGFNKKNGIRVFHKNGKYFDITLYDLEFSLKMIIGILCAIQKGAAISE